MPQQKLEAIEEDVIEEKMMSSDDSLSNPLSDNSTKPFFGGDTP